LGAARRELRGGARYGLGSRGGARALGGHAPKVTRRVAPARLTLSPDRTCPRRAARRDRRASRTRRSAAAPRRRTGRPRAPRCPAEECRSEAEAPWGACRTARTPSRAAPCPARARAPAAPAE